MILRAVHLACFQGPGGCVNPQQRFRARRGSEPRCSCKDKNADWIPRNSLRRIHVKDGVSHLTKNPRGVACRASVQGMSTLEETLNDASPATFEPQMDPGSLVSVMAVLIVVGLLQVRARAAEKARDGKAALEKKLQELRVKKMNENLPEDALNSLQKQILELEKQEEDAKTIMDFMGMKVSVITPRPIGSPIEDMDSAQNTRQEQAASTRQSTSGLGEEPGRLSASGIVLNILTIAAIPVLLLIVYQMAFVDPMAGGPGPWNTMDVGQM
mmetsp:Transcript_45604/g.87211  ORF Transcript_45604/g.87211 Transcript_45604/m.87211 type:complete len:270 (-) Transcript_45604:193-1002(-)|eukprot:CAMPEP_0114252194 /NCGR_PEP_ID=MMETSP0058-20121206/15701_1 /TAXON_ID=36894 /ORGANISM="Pyramimonas parkeae, CCMP726" /LENGTH=269 /DNA_ID=CAMNT_0001366101 /DNA_START=68 /DNA_END=877 /DNA_ORIENTATION=-